jgi:hypothetical protein
MADISAASWSDKYRRCRSIHGMGGDFRALVTSWQPPASFRAKCAAYRAAGVNVPADIEDDLVAIHARLRADGERPGYFDDVYHAATYILVIPLVTYQPRTLTSEETGSHPYVHRGQRNAEWAVSPNILRLGQGDPDTISPDLVRSRLRRTGAFVRRLRQRRPDLDEHHAAAVAQHYSSSANIRTWLIDMTSDPFVALWFASLGGEPGHVGIVESINLKAWNDIADVPGNPLGPARLLYPGQVPRLEAQHGLFLEAPSGMFWPQYLKQSLKFFQHQGVVFEDPEIGITQARLMPQDDELLRFAEEFAKDQSSPEAELEGESRLIGQLFVDFTSPEPYHSLARHVATKWHDAISADLDGRLRSISQFHATLLLPEYSEIMQGGFWSIVRFAGAVEYAALDAKNNASEPWRSTVARSALSTPEMITLFRSAQDHSERRFI